MILFQDFSKSYKKVPVIKKCTFSIPTNKITFFMGSNGAGKTTLIKCLAGLETYGGVITVDEKNIENSQQDMLIIWDDCPFYDNITGIQNLLIMSEINGVNEKDLIQVASKYISPELLTRKVKTYSYGQRKKLALALQTILNPEILVMDEISNGLDFDTMKQLKSDIATIAKGKSVILTGHQFSFYEGLVEEIYIIKDGLIENVTKEYDIEKGGLERIYERFIKDE